MNVELRRWPGRHHVYIRNGESVYCEHGHLLGTFLCDIYEEHSMTPIRVDLAPGAAIDMTKCHVCGGAVLNRNDMAFANHYFAALG